MLFSWTLRSKGGKACMEEAWKVQGVTQNVNIWLHAFLQKGKNTNFHKILVVKLILLSSLMDVVHGERKRTLPMMVFVYEYMY